MVRYQGTRPSVDCAPSRTFPKETPAESASISRRDSFIHPSSRASAIEFHHFPGIEPLYEAFHLNAYYLRFQPERADQENCRRDARSRHSEGTGERVTESPHRS